MHTLPAEIADTFAHKTFDINENTIAYYWRLSDGGVFEVREHRPTTTTIYRRYHAPTSEVAFCL